MLSDKGKIQLSCGLLQALFWIVYCFSFGFLVAYLTQIGYSKSSVGIIIAVLAVNAIIAQPVFGFISDKITDIKKVVFVAVLVSAVFVSLIPIFAQNFVTLLVICVILGWSEYGLASVVDCWCIRLGKETNASYGLGRACGSFAYAITAAVFGLVFTFVPVHMTFYLHTGVAILFLILIIKTKGVPPQKAVEKETDKPKGTNIFKVLLSDRRYVVFIICASMTFIGSSATSSFMINLLEMKGGTTEHLGYALCVQALFEIPAMIFSLKLLKKFNINFLLFFAMCAYILKFILPVFSQTPWGIVAAMMMQGVSFAVFLPSAMKYLALISPAEYQSTATTLAVGVYSGIGNIFGNLLGGMVADSLGVVWIYYLSALLAAVSAIVFFCFGRDKKVE